MGFIINDFGFNYKSIGIVQTSFSGNLRDTYFFCRNVHICIIIYIYGLDTTIIGKLIFLSISQFYPLLPDLLPLQF